MKHSLIISLWIIAQITIATANAADVWFEDFSSQDGKGLFGDSTQGIETNTSGITTWSVSGASGLDDDASLNWWMVTNGVFEGQDVGDAFGHWETEVIDITGETKVEIHMALQQKEGGLSGSENKFTVYYKLNAGTYEQELAINSDNQATYDGMAWTSSAIDVTSATTMSVKVSIKATIGDNGWSFDDVAVAPYVAPSNKPPVISIAPTNTDIYASVGDVITLTVSATEISRDVTDVIELTCDSLPTGATFATSTNVSPLSEMFTWMPTAAGTYTFAFEASDKDGTNRISVTAQISQQDPGRIWINEIHYDNANTDTNEGFEIAGPANWNLSEYVVYCYNGSGGASYGSLPLSGAIDDEKNHRGAVWFDWPGLQNGSPDGLALVHESEGVTNLLQFLSYEGTFVAVGGPADGFESTDIGVSELENTPLGESLQLTGTGKGYPDFTWTGPTPNSRGFLNAGQDIRLSPTVLIIR